MVVNGVLVKERNSKFNFTVENFEIEVKRRMSWSRENWSENGESNSSLNKLINSMRYWKKKIGKASGEKVVILTVFNEESEARLKILEIVEAIDGLDGDICIEGFSDFRNPRYIAIHFKTPQMKVLVEKKLKMIGLNYAVFLNWAEEAFIHNVRVHWLPMDHDINNLVKILEKYINIIEINKGSISILSGRKYKSGLLIVKGNLKAEMCLEIIPHVTMVDGFEVLFTIYGREPLCLTCNKLGHISASCPTPYCSKCKSLHGKKQNCVVKEEVIISYAQKVKGRVFENNLEVALEGHDLSSILEQPESICVDNTVLVSRKSNIGLPVDRNNMAIMKDTVTVTRLWADEGDEGGKFLLADEDVSSRGESSEADDENEEYLLSDLDNNVLAKMKEHLDELQNLKMPNLHSGKELLKNSCQIKKDDVNDETVVTEMEVSGTNLKRKSTCLVGVPPTESRNRGSRKTYGKNKVRVSSSNKTSNNLFDVLLGRGESQN